MRDKIYNDIIIATSSICALGLLKVIIAINSDAYKLQNTDFKNIGESLNVDIWLLSSLILIFLGHNLMTFLFIRKKTLRKSPSIIDKVLSLLPIFVFYPMWISIYKSGCSNFKKVVSLSLSVVPVFLFVLILTEIY